MFWNYHSFIATEMIKSVEQKGYLDRNKQAN